MIVIISTMSVQSAVKHCACMQLQRFSYRRLTTGTDWVSEYRRFAFGKDD